MLPTSPALGINNKSTSVKTPKLKKPANAFAAPSVFFGKSENFEGPKHKSLKSLWNFLNKKHKV